MTTARNNRRRKAKATKQLARWWWEPVAVPLTVYGMNERMESVVERTAMTVPRWQRSAAVMASAVRSAMALDEWLERRSARWVAVSRIASEPTTWNLADAMFDRFNRHTAPTPTGPTKSPTVSVPVQSKESA